MSLSSIRSTAILSTVRDMRRAPVRIATSILAIALAIAAIGVFAIPGVSQSSLQTLAIADNLTHIEIATTPLAESDVDGFTLGEPGAIEARTSGTVETAEHGNVLVVGRSNTAQIDRLRVVEGRLPQALNEIVVTEGFGSVGDTLLVRAATGDTTLTIVGIGDSTWFSDSATMFTSTSSAERLLGFEGVNRLVARLADPKLDNLERAVDDLRAQIEATGATVTAFPQMLEDGAHPIEEDINMVSFMIGSLGIVAGIVALILLASTANSIVTEKSRDAAIMRAVGGTRREVRRDLRRLAITIGVIGTIVGLPLGIIVANVIARMVLQRFAGITPDVGIDPMVMIGSAVFGIVGARLVSGRVARRVANTDLADALRDRDGIPFGQKWTNRILTRIPTGGLSHRMALRSIARRRARAFAVAAQFAGAVAAAVLVASLVTSILDFNDAEVEAYRWDTATSTADPLYPFELDGEQADTEAGIHTVGQVDDWELEIIGVDPATEMFDTHVVAGSWLTGDDAQNQRGVVVAERFAIQEGHALGDMLQVELAGGVVDYEIIGLHPIRSVAIFVVDTTLSADLGTDGRGDTVWTTAAGVPPATAGFAATTTTQAQLFAEGAAARDAILAIFGAIGLIVVAISALGASSTVAMNLYERRAEIATVRATGARRRDVRRLVRYELGGLATAGWMVGIVAGGFGARAIMDTFASTNAVELGFSMAWLAVPATAVAIAAFVNLLSATAARHSERKPIAVTLRAAT